MKTPNIDEQRRDRRADDFGMSSVMSQVLNSQFQSTLTHFQNAELSSDSPLNAMLMSGLNRAIQGSQLTQNAANITTQAAPPAHWAALRRTDTTAPTTQTVTPGSDEAGTLQLQSAVAPFTGGQGADKFQDIVQRASQKYGVPVALVNAVIKQESAFNPQAKSHAGACGLMQLMPKTATAYGCQNALDPEQNVMAGTRFLGDLLRMYKGDVELALAGYNAGPGNVAKYGNQVPPFAETKDYVVKVQGYYRNNVAMMDRGAEKFSKG